MAFARFLVLCVISDSEGRFAGVFSFAARTPASAPELSAAILRVRFRPALAGAGGGEDAAKLRIYCPADCNAENINA